MESIRPRDLCPLIGSLAVATSLYSHTHLLALPRLSPLYSCLADPSRRTEDMGTFLAKGKAPGRTPTPVRDIQASLGTESSPKSGLRIRPNARDSQGGLC